MAEYFDEYQLLKKIASGGMAEIFLAKHINSPVGNMPFAIKKVLPHYSKDKEYVKMFLSEARIICNINHQNIVHIYDFGKFEGIYYIAMEYVFGQNLGHLLSKFQVTHTIMPINVVFEIAMAVLAGLDHAHNARDRNGVFLNVVHLDMNPNNVLLGYDGKVKVVDFGIAHASYSKRDPSESSSIKGTYAYLSPEQCREENLDRRSDIFSIGIMLWEMLTGKPLFRHYESDVAIIQKILNEPIASPYSVNNSVSRYFSSIVMKSLEKDREKRYQTAADMLADIKKLQNTFEFNIENDSLSDLLRKNFASHYIKMTSLLEQSQKNHLMDALFDNMEELNLLNKTNESHNALDKIQAKKEQREQEKKPFLSPIKILLIAVFFLLVIMMVGAYIFKSGSDVVMVKVFSTPPGASIFINGDNIGKETPAFIPLEKGKQFVVEFRKTEQDEDGNELLFVGGTTILPDEKQPSISVQLKKMVTDR